MEQESRRVKGGGKKVGETPSRDAFLSVVLLGLFPGLMAAPTPQQLPLSLSFHQGHRVQGEEGEPC